MGWAHCSTAALPARQRLEGQAVAMDLILDKRGKTQEQRHATDKRQEDECRTMTSA